MQRVLVTGAAGFIGHYVVRQLLSRDHVVAGVDNINDYYDPALKFARLTLDGITQSEVETGGMVQSQVFGNYSFTRADIADRGAMERLFDEFRPDGVIHLAAQAGVRYSLVNPYVYTESNVTGFLNILEGCRRHSVKHLVYASTSSVYGLNTKLPLNPHDPTEHPMSLYAATKKANEMMAHSYSHLFGLPSTGVRFFTVYGPWGRPDMALFLFTRSILEGKPIRVFNEGKMIRDFTYAEDIAEGVARIFARPPTPDPEWNGASHDASSSSAPYRIVNIGNDEPVTVLDYIEAIEAATGKKAVKQMEPMQPGDVPATHADLTDLINLYDYRPKMPVREGVGSFVRWYRDYYGV